MLKDYLAPPVKNLPEFSEIKFDCKTELLLDQVLQFKYQSDFAQVEPQAPRDVGIEAIPSPIVEISSEMMPKKDWVCDDLQDTEAWRQWLQKIQYSLIKYSPVEVIRYCENLSQISQTITRNLFNYAYFSFYSDANLSNEWRTTVQQMIKNALLSTSIPKDIVQ